MAEFDNHTRDIEGQIEVSDVTCRQSFSIPDLYPGSVNLRVSLQKVTFVVIIPDTYDEDLRVRTFVKNFETDGMDILSNHEQPLMKGENEVVLDLAQMRRLGYHVPQRVPSDKRDKLVGLCFSRGVKTSDNVRYITKSVSKAVSVRGPNPFNRTAKLW